MVLKNTIDYGVINQIQIRHSTLNLSIEIVLCIFLLMDVIKMPIIHISGALLYINK